MEDLRWILMLVGALVIAAVYFSSRFEREDWVREREQFDARNQSLKKASKKTSQKKPDRQQPVTREALSPAAHSSAVQKPRIEPHMTTEGGEVENARRNDSPIASTMLVDEEDESVTAFDSTVLDSGLSSTPSSTPTQSSTSSAVEASNKKSKVEPGLEPELNSSAEKASTVQDFPSTPVEEKIAVKPDEVDGQEMLKASSTSEIPTKVTLTEETVSELVDSPDEIQNQKQSSEVEDEVPDLSIRPGIEDEITGIEIPADLAIAEAELHASINNKTQQNDKREKQTVETALPPNIEPLVLVLTVMAEDEPFTGSAVKEALEAEGLRHGEMRIFHSFDESLDLDIAEADSSLEKPIPVFSVASLVEPGYFELEKIKDMEMPGLTLFCQLPGPLSGAEAFNFMLDKGRGIAVRLHGQLCDDKHNHFTTQAKTHYQDRIATYTRKLAVAKKKAGV